MKIENWREGKGKYRIGDYGKCTLGFLSFITLESRVFEEDKRLLVFLGWSLGFCRKARV